MCIYYMFIYLSLFTFNRTKYSSSFHLPTVQFSHCAKSVHIQSYSGPHFFRIFPHSDRIFCISVFSPNAEKMRTRITVNTDTFTQCHGLWWWRWMLVWAVSHSCSLACQQRVLKTFAGQRSISLKVTRKYWHQAFHHY